MTSVTTERTEPARTTNSQITKTNTNPNTRKDTTTMYALLHDRPIADLTGFDRSELDGAPVAVRTPQARCADGNGTLTHLFFSDDVIAIARAKAICAKCKLTASCLESALERSEPWGVWGGELIENGRIVVTKRPRGRPPKHPRPVLVIDEVPIPPHLVA